MKAFRLRSHFFRIAGAEEVRDYTIDSDGDGLSDGLELELGLDPVQSDTDDNLYREIAFDIGGDYAAWTMIVVGEGPHDATVRRLQMGGAGLGQRRILRLRKGNRYRLTMVWLNSDEYDDETHGH